MTTKTKIKDRPKTLSEINPKDFGSLSQLATIRSQYLLFSLVGTIFTNYGRDLKALTFQIGKGKPSFDASGQYQLKFGITTLWKSVVSDYARILEQVTRAASGIPFAQLCVESSQYLNTKSLSESDEPTHNSENLQAILSRLQEKFVSQVRNNNVYNDPNYNRFSARIHKLELEGDHQIDLVLSQGFSRGLSAFELAQQLESSLALNADCPRWAAARLKLTKAQIAEGDRLGLFSGDECSGQGVAYNALRLARTETSRHIQYVTTSLFEAMPWVTKIQCRLSPAHVGPDICDEIVRGGEGGKGIYPVGQILYPVHPHCLCYTTAIHEDRSVFDSRLKSWTRGETEWAEMDTFQTMLGGELGTSLSEFGQTAVANTLLRWLNDSEAELKSMLDDTTTGGS